MSERLNCMLVLLAVAGLARADGALERYLSLTTGSFTSEAQAARDDRYDAALWHTARIWPAAGGEAWTYTENWLADAQAPYRQRIARHWLDESGAVRSRSYRIPGAERFVGAWEDPARFDALEPRDLDGESGCETVLARTAPDRFEGGTRGQGCDNRYRGADYMVSRTVITGQEIVNWDRGFKADGTQVWGPVAGGYRFRRVGAGTCAEPVIMVVYGAIEDREKFGAYAAAIGRSGLYPRNQGYYLAITPAIDVFEGDVPAERGAVLARFPCAAAARAFWGSPEYAEIRRIRQGISEFEVLLLRELPVPGYVTW